MKSQLITHLVLVWVPQLCQASHAGFCTHLELLSGLKRGPLTFSPMLVWGLPKEQRGQGRWKKCCYFLWEDRGVKSQKLIHCHPREVFSVWEPDWARRSVLLRSAASSSGARMIQLVTLLCMEPISVPGRQKTEGGGKRTTPCHSSFKELLVAGWCPAAPTGGNWLCW